MPSGKQRAVRRTVDISRRMPKCACRAVLTDVLQRVREEGRDNAPDGRVHHQAQHQQLPGLCARRHNPALPRPLTQPS